MSAKALIRGDSNLMKIKTHILDSNSTCEKIFIPTFNHVSDFLHKVTVETQPGTVLFQCGTNDLEIHEFTEEVFENNFIEVIMKLRKVFPKCSVVISSMLPREENEWNHVIRRLNDFMSGCCAGSFKMAFMFNVNIYKNMLRGRKHVNREGFRTFLSNIRYTVFGKIPKR